ncbi:hypothetical protein PoB_005219700 [Plakobranchus ocellatus]|uniref:Uncharacterized protein n=1 Tax=Plakobranchus ocellatus TaxID=259542 RepID=A0AAV4C260_9GAST|nr:hypothetical protein PoB_005219700 [Plakobranchus ocellatus]
MSPRELFRSCTFVLSDNVSGHGKLLQERVERLGFRLNRTEPFVTIKKRCVSASDIEELVKVVNGACKPEIDDGFEIIDQPKCENTEDANNLISAFSLSNVNIGTTCDNEPIHQTSGYTRDVETQKLSACIRRVEAEKPIAYTRNVETEKLSGHTRLMETEKPSQHKVAITNEQTNLVEMDIKIYCNPKHYLALLSSIALLPKKKNCSDVSVSFDKISDCIISLKGEEEEVLTIKKEIDCLLRREKISSSKKEFSAHQYDLKERNSQKESDEPLHGKHQLQGGKTEGLNESPQAGKIEETRNVPHVSLAFPSQKNTRKDNFSTSKQSETGRILECEERKQTYDIGKRCNMTHRFPTMPLQRQNQREDNFSTSKLSELPVERQDVYLNASSGDAQAEDKGGAYKSQNDFNRGTDWDSQIQKNRQTEFVEVDIKINCHLKSSMPLLSSIVLLPKKKNWSSVNVSVNQIENSIISLNGQQEEIRLMIDGIKHMLGDNMSIMRYDYESKQRRLQKMSFQ